MQLSGTPMAAMKTIFKISKVCSSLEVFCTFHQQGCHSKKLRFYDDFMIKITKIL